MASEEKKVLHVDDEAPIREIVSSILGLHQVSVLEAHDPVEGMEVLMKHKDSIALIISDFMMPQKSGLDFLKEIRDLGIDTPFMFLSAFKSEDNKKKARELGSLGFIEKPFDSVELAETVTDFLSKS